MRDFMIDFSLNFALINQWRESMVPSAAVIPALQRYILIVAVKEIEASFYLEDVQRIFKFKFICCYYTVEMYLF